MFNKYRRAGIDTDISQAGSPHAGLNPSRLANVGPQPGLEPLEPRLLLSGSMSAQFVPVDNTSALSGFNTFDLVVTSDSDWSAASLLIELTQGSIYQDPAGGDREPNPVLFSAFPTLEFDSYVAANGHSLSILGSASELGGDELQFDTNEIDITWFDLAKDDLGTVVIGRVTLSDDAVGSLDMKILNGGSDSFTTSDTFTSGDLVNLTPAAPRPPTPPPPPTPSEPLDFTARFVEVDNSAVLTGFKTFDLQVTTDVDWTATALLIELTQGSFYQDPAGSDLAPHPFFFDANPTLEFDTYVTANGNSTSISGGAGDVGGDGLRFDTTELDISWFDSATNDVGTIVIGRFTLSDNAAGSVSLFVLHGGLGDRLIVSDTFAGGDLSGVVPDPIPSSLPAPPPPAPTPEPPPPPTPPTPKPITAQFIEVDNSAALAGFKTFDIQITTNTDWSSASLLVDLTRGSIYQDTAGTDLAPNPVTFNPFSSLQFDTYVTANGSTTSIGGDSDGAGGGASRFDATQIDITWSGPATDDIGTLIIGRVTLSDDAVGGLKLMISGDRNEFTDTGTFAVGDLANLKSTATPASAAAADFTGDGKADILWRNASNGLSSLWQMNRTTFVSSIDIPLPRNANWQAVGTGDLTGDGKADILWRNRRNGRNRVTAMDGTAVQERTYIKGLRNQNWIVAGIGDFTGDGKADILWRNKRNGRNKVWEMDGTTFQGTTAIQRESTRDWIIAGVTDFTGDGKADILWRNTRNGNNRVWEMDGTSLQNSTEIKQLKSQRWQIAGVGDYTGDGKADILWRHTKRGKNSVWQMNGTEAQKSIAIRTQADRDWQPAGTLLGLWE